MKFFNRFKRKRKEKKPPLINWRPVWIILVVLAVAGYLIFIFSRSLWRNWEINNQVTGDEIKIEELKDQQNYLENLIAYYQTKSFIEKEARGKLGLKKEGESVLALPRQGKEEKKETIEAPQNSQKETTNAAKWWRFFFGS